MLGVIWVLTWLVVSRRIPVSFPLQLSNQLGSPFIFSALQKAESVQRDSAGSAGPVGCVCLILRHVETACFAFLSSLLWTITRQLLWGRTNFTLCSKKFSCWMWWHTESQHWEAGTREWQVWGQLGLRSGTLSQKEKRKVSLLKEKADYNFKVKMGNDHNVWN